MNWLDIVIGAILVFSILGALKSGLTREVVRLVALLIGIFGGMWWHKDVAAALYQPHIADERVAAFAGFATILIGSLVLGMAVAWLLVNVWGWAGLGWFDRLLGGAFGLVRGLLVAACVVLAVVAFAPVAGSNQTVADSRLAPWVLHGARATVALAPAELEQAYLRGFEKIREIWSRPVSAVGAQAANTEIQNVKSSPTGKAD